LHLAQVNNLASSVPGAWHFAQNVGRSAIASVMEMFSWSDMMLLGETTAERDSLWRRCVERHWWELIAHGRARA